ncbi:hypothetical protein IAT38_006458 [Cryptococcus sp. DSM 104549]
MAVYQHALAAMNNQTSGSSSSVSIRGASANAGPASRIAANALRGAGITRSQSMDIDGAMRGSGSGRGGGAKRSLARSTGPLDQTGRHRPNTNAKDNKPYQKPPTGPARGRGGRHSHPGRLPAGTPPTIQQLRAPNKSEREHGKSELNKKLGSDEMKAWLKSKMVAEGVLDMANLSADEWIKESGIIPIGHRNAPPNTGLVFWRLIDQVFQKTDKITITTLSLARNNLTHLRQLEKLPICLPDITALDLSDNPIGSFSELDHILAQGEKKGKANAGMGSLKRLVELKLNGCDFREKALAQPDGEAIYKHEILRRFPGLLVLDGVNLDRVVFAVSRKPKVKLTDVQRKELLARPFSFPVDVQPNFHENEGSKDFSMTFLGQFIGLFDNDRAQCFPAYAPNALISISCNTLASRSFLANEVTASRMDRPKPAPFEAWVNLPSRNFFRNATGIKERTETLQSPADPQALLAWWEKKVPKTSHPVTDPSKWVFESWILDGQNPMICLMVQGQFQEMPSGTFRSFSRTFILSTAPEGSAAQQAGWQATIHSDTMIVHSYLGTGAFDSRRSLAFDGVTIQPPAPAPASVPALPGSAPGPQGAQGALLAAVSQRTGMNAQYAAMCLEQNGWNVEEAVKNFEEIKGSIPAEAFV